MLMSVPKQDIWQLVLGNVEFYTMAEIKRAYVDLLRMIVSRQLN